MTLRLKNIGLFKQATNLYTRMANLTELNIRNMEEEMEDGKIAKELLITKSKEVMIFITGYIVLCMK